MQAQSNIKSDPDLLTQQVRKRHVLFIPGYDPIAPRRYRELYRREASRQAAISGYEIAVEGQKTGSGITHGPSGRGRMVKRSMRRSSF